MADDFYNTGTVSVAAGGTTVTATGALWSGVLPGDTIEIGDLPARTIAVPTDATHLELAVPVGIDIDDVPYTIRFNAPIRFASYTIAARQREVLDRISILDVTRPNYEVQSVGANAPPGSPAEDDMYVVGTAPTGAWAGRANSLAQWLGTSWQFTAPEISTTVVSAATGIMSIWNGAAWVAPVSQAEAARDTALAALATSLSVASPQAFTAAQKLQGQQNIGATPGKWFIDGLRYATNSADTTNDFNIFPGVARDHLDSLTMVLSTMITKRLDANWAPGHGNGGRYSGAAIANVTYHMYLVAKPFNAAVDVYADPSPVPATVLAHLQAEPGGADYVSVRRIASIPREAGILIGVVNYKDTFERTPVTDRNDPSAFASGLLALSIPTGIQVYPILVQRYATSSGGVLSLYMGSADRNAAIVNTLRTGSAGSGVPARWWGLVPVFFLSNTSAQIYFQQVNDSGTPTEAFLITYGWIDPRTE